MAEFNNCTVKHNVGEDVQEESDEDVQLSSFAAEALKEFALEKGLDVDYSSSGGDFVQQIQEKFDIKEKEDAFEYSFGEGEAEVQVLLHGLKKELGQTLSSTGLTMWRAAEELARLVFEQKEMFEDCSVLELGAGLGLCGILAAKVGRPKKVVLTDGCPETCERLRQNIEANGPYEQQGGQALQPEVEQLWWGQHQEFCDKNPLGFDIILAADVIYEDEAVVPLITTAQDILKISKHASPSKEPVFVLAFARRNVSIDSVLTEAENIGLTWKVAENFVPQNALESIYFISLANKT